MKVIKVFSKDFEAHNIKVDDEDYVKLKKYQWFWKDGYAVTKWGATGRSVYQMHRMIAGALFKEDVIIDHRDNDHTNNQKANLRRADRFQNQQNRKTNKNNVLPKGIRQMPNGKYNVRVQTHNKRLVFGSFDTIEEAIEARNAKAREMHGEFFHASAQLEDLDYIESNITDDN